LNELHFRKVHKAIYFVYPSLDLIITSIFHTCCFPIAPYTSLMYLPISLL